MTTPKKILDENSLIAIRNFVSNTKCIEITYESLKELRDNEQLVSGQFYRMIDYDTVASGYDIAVANHHFDLILLSLDESHLSENARACHSERDEEKYFKYSNLETWEIKYCIDNDSDRFEWADTTNGKGVIYYMKDEFGNECPYDFKNILFHKGVYTFDTLGGEYHDYENMLGGQDGSINHTMNIHNNIVKPWIESGIQKLNCNLFRGESFFNNVYECNCHHNVIKTNAHNNHFLEDVNNNVFQPDASGNTLGCHTRENTFGKNFYYNDVGIHVEGCTFGDECQNNKIGNKCTNIKFGDKCKRNEINSEKSGLTLTSGTEDCEYI